MTRRRRWIIIAGGLAAVLVAAALVVRGVSSGGRLPWEVRSRMPAHWRIPWGLPAGVREGIEGLYSPDPDRRAKAAASLEDYGPQAAPAIPWLVAILADGADSPADQAAANVERSVGEEILDYILGRVPERRDATWAHYYAEAMVREHAVHTLEEIGEPAVEPLIAALQDPLPEVRASAAFVLGDIGDERAIDPLAAAWPAHWPRKGLPCNEADSLALIGGRGIDILIQRLGAGTPETREMAAAALGNCQIDCPRAVEPLVAALKDPNQEVAVAAAYSLGHFRGDRATDALVAALDSPIDEVRSAAASSLGAKPDTRAADALIAAVERSRGPEAAAAAEALGRIGDRRAVEPLIRWLSRAPSGQRAEAAGAWARSATRAVEPLLAALEQKDAGPRDLHGDATIALGEIGDARAVPALIQGLLVDKDPCDYGRTALARIGPPAVEPLVAVLQDKVQGPLAADALGRIGDRRAFEPLLAAMKSEDPFLRKAAAKAIGRLGDPRALAPLLEALNDPELAFEAAAGLGYLGDPQAVEPILAAVERYGATVKNRPAKPAKGPASGAAAEEADCLLPAAGALIRLGDPRGLDVLRRVYPPDSTQGLGEKVGPAGIKMLAEAMSDENKQVRDLATLCLLQDESPEAIAALLAVYPTLSPGRRESLALVLGLRSRYPRASEALAEILRTDKDHHVRILAATGLGWRGDPVAAEALRRAAEDPEPRVRKAAAAALEYLLRMNPPDVDPPRWQTRQDLMTP